MADANTALVVLASTQGALTAVLAAATGYYAWRTRDISEAAKRQADASMAMTLEMREQRYASQNCQLIPRLVKWDNYEGQVNVQLTIDKQGPGSALNVERVVKHPDVSHQSSPTPSYGSDVRIMTIITEASTHDAFVLRRPLSAEGVDGAVELTWLETTGRSRHCSVGFTPMTCDGEVRVPQGLLKLDFGTVVHDP